MQYIVVGCAFFNAKVFLTLIMFSFEFNFPSQINHPKNFRVKFFKEKTTLPYVVDELIYIFTFSGAKHHQLSNGNLIVFDVGNSFQSAYSCLCKDELTGEERTSPSFSLKGKTITQFVNVMFSRILPMARRRPCQSILKEQMAK